MAPAALTVTDLPEIAKQLGSRVAMSDRWDAGTLSEV
jgi:hypothetical protein